MIDIGTGNIVDVLRVPCRHRRVHLQMWTCIQSTTFRAYAFFNVTLHLGQS